MIGNKIGSLVIELEETDSTNSYASRLLQEHEVAEGTAIMAHFQTSGRGQRSSGWESESHKNLTVSYILSPGFLPITNHFVLNQAISLGVYDFIKSKISADVAIKWPNDILVGNSKIAGILIENSLRGTKITHSVVGIGINVNQIQFADYEPPATSLAKIEVKEFELRKLLDELSENLDKWYTRVRLGHFRQINQAYEEAMFQRNKLATYQTPEGKFQGTITGVTDDGRLEILKQDGIPVYFMNKEVRYLY
ncbi:MAG: biotin--[acetyl-CoA-carboxylase] ligase [Bacteroidetes bacterium]|nr:biotin--[acetyl-CoA-carboxylase] ligase [Candidatus Vicinibacter affinis]MBK9048959.1 biotin--[acetyl-CoA-carboxylase] ligase [Bacteroidota bacterium]MBK9423182.1 biotin--[acetyl-CoA-carboxylase] ligase [Bacteroidota bacterium]